MHRIRYYNQLFEPYLFGEKNRPWKYRLRGWWIRVLNRVRLFIEFRVTYHVMLYLGNADGIDKARIKEFVKAWKQDVREEKALLQPVLNTRPTLDDVNDLLRNIDAHRKVGRLRSAQALFARLMAGPREKRYAKGLSSERKAEAEDAFDPVTETTEQLPVMEVSYARGEDPAA